MVDNIVHNSIRNLSWKKHQYDNYRRIGLIKSRIPIAVNEVINPELRKTNYQLYKQLLRQYYLNKHGILLSDRTDPVALQEVLFSDVYSNFEEFIPSRGSTVLDIGAQFGDYAILCSKKFAVGKVFSFEPLANNFEIMNENVRLNSLDNIFTYNKAIGSREGVIKVSGSNNMASAFDKDGEESVELVTVDSFGVDKVDIMKVDVEGFEMEALRGAKETLMRDSPKLIIEVHTKSLKDQVLKFTGDLGYGVLHSDKPRINREMGMDHVQNLFLAV